MIACSSDADSSCVGARSPAPGRHLRAEVVPGGRV